MSTREALALPPCHEGLASVLERDAGYRHGYVRSLLQRLFPHTLAAVRELEGVGATRFDETNPKLCMALRVISVHEPPHFARRSRDEIVPSSAVDGLYAACRGLAVETIFKGSADKEIIDRLAAAWCTTMRLVMAYGVTSSNRSLKNICSRSRQWMRRCVDGVSEGCETWQFWKAIKACLNWCCMFHTDDDYGCPHGTPRFGRLLAEIAGDALMVGLSPAVMSWTYGPCIVRSDLVGHSLDAVNFIEDIGFDRIPNPDYCGDASAEMTTTAPRRSRQDCRNDDDGDDDEEDGGDGRGNGTGTVIAGGDDESDETNYDDATLGSRDSNSSRRRRRMMLMRGIGCLPEDERTVGGDITIVPETESDDSDLDEFVVGVRAVAANRPLARRGRRTVSGRSGIASSRRSAVSRPVATVKPVCVWVEYARAEVPDDLFDGPPFDDISPLDTEADALAARRSRDSSPLNSSSSSSDESFRPLAEIMGEVTRAPTAGPERPIEVPEHVQADDGARRAVVVRGEEDVDARRRRNNADNQTRRTRPSNNASNRGDNAGGNGSNNTNHQQPLDLDRRDDGGYHGRQQQQQYETPVTGRSAAYDIGAGGNAHGPMFARRGRPWDRRRQHQSRGQRSRGRDAPHPPTDDRGGEDEFERRGGDGRGGGSTTARLSRSRSGGDRGATRYPTVGHSPGSSPVNRNRRRNHHSNNNNNHQRRDRGERDRSRNGTTSVRRRLFWNDGEVVVLSDQDS